MPYRTKAPDEESRLYHLVLRAERHFIARALSAFGHNRTYTAKFLGISRRTLLNKIAALNLRTRPDVLAAREDDMVSSYFDAAQLAPKKETH